MDPFTPISELGEFGLIDRIQSRVGERRSPVTVKGIGDDAAVLNPTPGMKQVVTTDLLIEHIHFDRTYTPMRYLGYKAMSSNISDIAAMNAVPDVATISVGIPNTVSVEMVDALYDGIVEAGLQYGVDIIGGDISASHKLVISVTLIGHATDSNLVYRNGAKPSDIICVSGHLGGSFAGLQILQYNKDRMTSTGPGFVPDLASHSYVIQRHLHPEARMDFVKALADSEVKPTAMIDISDGVASEIRHICSASQCGAQISADDLPIHEGTTAVSTLVGDDALDYALYGGEEYELLFTVEPDSIDKLLDSDVTFFIIGSCLPLDAGIDIVLGDGTSKPILAEGFRHF